MDILNRLVPFRLSEVWGEGYQEASSTGEVMVALAVGVKVLSNDRLVNIESIGFAYALEVGCE